MVLDVHYLPKRLCYFILPGAVNETSLIYHLIAFDIADQILSSLGFPGCHPILVFHLLL